MIGNNKQRFSIFITTLTLFLFTAVGCGGVAKNPAESPWKDKKDQTGMQTGGKSTEEGAPPIREGASYDELVQTARLSLESGFIKNAAEAYLKALETQKEKPDAALSYAIVKIAGSVRELSLLMPPGIDLLFYNTPLIGRWEILPSPLADDDSYLLRLAALGTKYSTPYSPKTKTEQKATSPSGEGSQTPSGIITPPKPNGDKKSGDEAPLKPKSPTGDTQGRGTQFYSPQRETSQSLGGGAVQQGDGAGSVGGTTGGTGTSGGTGGAFQFGGTTQRPANLTLSKDIFPDLIKEYKEIARTYNSGFLNFDAVNAQANELKKMVDDVVQRLEYAKRNVDSEKFALELPFILDNEKKGVYQIYFRGYDYHIILGYMKLIQAELNYRLAYKTDAPGFSLYLPVSDNDSDNNLTPSEYYPPAPFGNAVDKLPDMLRGISDSISGSTNALVKALDEFYNDDKLMDYAGNRIIPANINQTLLDKISEERNKYSDFQVAMTSGKGKRELKTRGETLKLEISFANMFGEKAPTSVSALLPTLNATTFEPVPDAQGNNFPDPTWGGIFTEPNNNFETFRARSDINGLLTFQGEPIKDVQITITGRDTVKSDEKGRFTVKEVEYNELVGIPLNVTSEQIQKPIQAQIRVPCVNFDLMLLDQTLIAPPVTQSGGMTQTGEGGATTVAPPTEAGGQKSTTGRIDEIKKQREKGEGEKKESGEQGDGTQLPPSPSTG